jgi:hypothetical protein
MVVTEPLKVTITNFPHDSMIELSVLNFPGEESRGSHTIKFDSVIYIEKSDFSEVKIDQYKTEMINFLLSDTSKRFQTFNTESVMWIKACSFNNNC